MSFTTPQELLEAFFRTFNAGDLDATLALYEPNAMLVAEPGKTVQGMAALREALGAFLAMKPKLTPDKSEMLTTSDLALSLVKWTLNGTGPDGKPLTMTGTSSDVARRQPDGTWRLVIDNPWGTAIVG